MIVQSFHPWDLSEFKFLITAKMLFSVMFREVSVLSVLSWSVGNLLESCNGIHYDSKYLLKIAVFLREIWDFSPSANRFDIAGTFLLLRRWFNLFSANFTKWSNTLKQFVGNLATNSLSVFDHFVGLGLNIFFPICIRFRGSFTFQRRI